jgi:RNA polymerase sigma-70 factor (ECF subfamily)
MEAEHSSDRPAGEDHAVAQAFQQHSALLYSVVFGMLGDSEEAAEIIQEIRDRWVAASAGRPARSPAGLLRLATGLALMRLRAAQSTGESHLGPWLPEPLLNEPGLCLAESVSVAMSIVVDTLQHDERTVFLLRHGFGLSYADIAAVTGHTECHVRRIDAEAGARVRCENGDGEPPEACN